MGWSMCRWTPCDGALPVLSRAGGGGRGGVCPVRSAGMTRRVLCGVCGLVVAWLVVVVSREPWCDGVGDLSSVR